MRTQCPNCKKPIKLTTSQLMNNQSRITCPGCHQAITTQSTIKQARSSLKLR